MSGPVPGQGLPLKDDKTEEMMTKEGDENRKKLLTKPIYIYSTYLAGCYYDKAREIADKERDSFKNISSMFPNRLFYSVLSQLCGVEKQYMSLAYLAPKRFLMKDTSLSNQYTHLYNEISRLGDKSQGKEIPVDAEIGILGSHIKNFIRARIALVDFYEKICLAATKAIQASLTAASPQLASQASGQNVTCSNDSEKQTMLLIEEKFVPSIEEIYNLYSLCLSHTLLAPLNASYTCELTSIKSFLVTLQHTNKWRFFDSIMTHDTGCKSLTKWSEILQNSVKGLDYSTSTRMTFFDSLRSLTSSTMGGSGAEQVEPVLLDWFTQLKGSLHSRITLYFYETLLSRTSAQDMKEKCLKCSIDFPSKVTAFQRRIEATAIALVFDATPDQATYKGPGFHFGDNKLTNPLQGLDLYPAPFISPIIGTNGTCIPQDEVARHWPCVVKIINDFSEELGLPDRIVYVFDHRLENTYYLMKIDPQITIVVIFERSKMEKDPQITNFLLETSFQLRCTKNFASLKPGYK